VPCHRVIGSDGSLTGYGGGIERKAYLLDMEGRR
jgi:methylated-DNA-[protein]-cysteine S-methyltransferase